MLYNARYMYIYIYVYTYIYIYIYKQWVFVFEFFEGDFWNEWTSFSLLNLEGSDSEIAMEKRERERGVLISLFFSGMQKMSHRNISMVLPWCLIDHGNNCGKAFGVISDVPATVLGAVFALRVFASKQWGQGGRCKSSRRGCEGRDGRWRFPPLDGCNEAPSVTLDLCHGSPLRKSNSTHK